MTRNVSNYFKEKVVVISGGASGIGKALAEQLATHKSYVVLLDRDIAAAQSFCQDLQNAGANACAYALDVRDREAFTLCIQQVLERYKRIDVMINNAGIAIGGPAFEYSPEDWKYIVDVNLNGVIHGIDAVYGIMRKQGFGQIVNTASVVALFPNVLTISYSCTKAAVHSLSMTLRLEAKNFGIKVNSLCPGAVDTPILLGGQFGRISHGVSKAMLQRYWKKMQPMSAERFAHLALIGISKNRACIILPKWWHCFVWSYRLCVPIWLRYSNKMLQKFFRAREKSATSATGGL